MKLLVEEIDDFQILTEETETGKRRYFMEGIFMQAEKPNRNKRVYPYNTMRKEVDRYIREEVNKNRAYGTNGHLDTPKIPEDKVSHRIRELRFEGNDVYGKASILNNPNGQMIISIIEDQGSFGMSSKALGSVKPKGGINVVQEDFSLRSVDCVLAPSGIDCYVTGLMESADWIYDSIKQEWVPQFIQESQVIINEVYKSKPTQSEIENVGLLLWGNLLKKL